MNRLSLRQLWCRLKRARGRAFRPSRRDRLGLGFGPVHQLETRQLLANFSITYSATVPAQPTDYNVPLSLPKFTPSLGTLTEVDLSFNASGTQGGTLTNVAPGPQSFAFDEVVNLSLLDGATTLLSPNLEESQSYTNVPASGDVPFGPYAPTQTSSAVYTTGATFDQFAGGPGNVALAVQTNTTQTISGGGGNIRARVSTTAGGTATVTYLYTAAPVTISGNVYDDRKGTGALAPGDAPIPGTTLTLRDSSGTVVATTTTGAEGTYAFTTTTAGGPLSPGTYSVAETQPAGFLQGTNTVGTVGGVTDGNLPATDVIGSIALTSGQASVGNNFGEVLPVTIAGNVYDDLKGTGTLAPGDAPIPGTVLTLIGANGTVVATTTTAANGTYSFLSTTAGASLPPGTYSVAETQPAGFLQGTNTVGTVGGVTDGTLPSLDVIGSIALTSGQASVGNNFGEVLPVTIAGNVYEDLKGTGSLAPGDAPIPGTVLTLIGANGTVVATTTTAANGTYSFLSTTAGAPLPPGTYSVAETQPAGFLQGTNTVGTVNGVADGTLPSLDLIGSIALTSGQASVGNNFGEVLPVTISGTVYDDADQSGTITFGDSPIPGTTLNLLNAAGTVVATTTTNSVGAYAFTTTAAGASLPPGTYSVAETQPAGFLQGTNTVGTVGGVTDGTLPSLDVIGSIALTSGQASVGNNFGEITPVTISGTVYDDILRAGRLLPGDLPIAGVTLVLFGPSGEVATTTTNAFGTYSFATNLAGQPLPPSNYTLVELQPAGFQQGTNTVGTVNGVTDGSLVATDVIGGIRLASGQASVGNNFGELTLVPPTPLNLTNVQRFGVHLQPTLIVLTFDSPLNPVTAENIGNYQVFGPTDSKHPAVVPIESVTFDPPTNSVTLRFGERLNVHHPYRLTVIGLRDLNGGLLVGSDGQAGGALVTTLNRSKLAGFTDIYGNFIPINHGQLYPAANASGYQLKRFVAPANLGPFAAINRASFLAATAGDPEVPPIDHLPAKKAASYRK